LEIKGAVPFNLSESKKQFFVETHSHILLNSALRADQKVFRCWREKGPKQPTQVSPVTGLDETSAVLDALGITPGDILLADIVVYVEGPTDIGVFEKIIMKFEDLKRINIKCVSLGGGDMGNDEVKPKTFLKINRRSVAVIDSEKKSKTDTIEENHARFAEKCKIADMKCFVLDRGSVENYFTARVLKVAGFTVPNDDFEVRPYEGLQKQGVKQFPKGKKIER